MKRLLSMLAVSLLGLSLSAGARMPEPKANPQNINSARSNIAYTVTIPGTRLADGSFTPAQVFDITRLDKKDYQPATIHIKTREHYSFSKDDKVLHSSVVMASLKNLGISNIREPFASTGGDKIQSAEASSLDRIYEINYTNGQDPYDVCMELMNNPAIEYACPVFNRYECDFSPDDPQIGSQWAVATMQLKKAWEITKGSKDVLIAIVDSGVDWQHEDLAGNIWTNPKEIPGNGKDDDGNGKIDDVHGWDLIGNISTNDIAAGNWKEDNDPTNIPGFHGTHVAGLASAATNNGVGIAGTGFSCSILPVKCGSEQYSNGVLRGYEGIKYAADMGAKVINCSWGGQGNSPVEQEIINYAVSKGAVVVVATGNEGSYIDDGGDYPACYKNVLSVGSTASNDKMSAFSNYGINTTVLAPGQGIFSTLPNNRYGNLDGTSMATPIVSGLAGLVWSLHPDWTPRQVIHQIRSTTDNVISTSESQRPYVYGRVNAFRAVDLNNTPDKNIPGVELTDFSLQGGDALTGNDPVTIKLNVKNFLGQASGLKVKFTALDNFISINDASQASLDAGDLATNETKPFNVSVRLLPNNPWYNGSAKILVTFESGDYTDYQLMSIPVKVSSTNLYATTYFFPSGAGMQWHNIVPVSQNMFWAAFQSPYVQGGNVIKYSGGQPALLKVSSTDAVYCVSPMDDMTAFAGTGSQSGSSAYIYKTTDGGSSWSQKIISSMTGFVNDIHFFDENNGVFLGDPKSSKWGVATTSDAGASWNLVSNINTPLSNETGLVGSTAWIGQDGWFGTTAGRVFHSTDGGQSWKGASISGAAQVQMVAFKDDKSGIAVYQESTQTGAPVLMAATADGGQTWTANKFNFTANGLFPVSGFTVPNTNRIFVVFGDGKVYSTPDNGTTWTPVLSQEHGYVQEGAFFNTKLGSARIWDLGEKIGYLDFNYDVENANREISITSGNSYDFGSVDIGKGKIGNITVKNTGNVDVNIFDAATAPAAGIDSSEFKIFGPNKFTIAAGAEAIIKVRFSPKQEGARTGKLVFNTDVTVSPTDRTVSLSGNGQNVSSVRDYDEVSGLSISSISPNPASVEAVLEYSTREASTVGISILDMNGSTVSNVFNGTAAPGANSLHFSTQALASGVYYIQINSAGRSVARKFVVEK